jgi:predicted PurR-regulated permease PerM
MDMTDAAEPRAERRQITLVPSNVWRVGLVILGVIALGLVLRFILSDGGTVIFTVLMSWFAAIAMAPVVDRLSRRMRRGTATILVMLTFVLLTVVFIVAFGSLMVGQLSDLVLRIPDLIDSALTWANEKFSMSMSTDDILSSVGGGSIDFASVAQQVGGNLLGILGSVLGSVFGLFRNG